MPAFVLDLHDRGLGMVTSSDAALGVYLDVISNTLYFTDGTTTYKWDNDTSSPKSYNYRSRNIWLPRLVNLGAAMVIAESYNDLTFKLYADGRLKHTKVVTSDDPFRLPGGYLSDDYQIQLEGTDEVSAVYLGETIFEIQGQ